jgi:hypothetical protein
VGGARQLTIPTPETHRRFDSVNAHTDYRERVKPLSSVLRFPRLHPAFIADSIRRGDLTFEDALFAMLREIPATCLAE